MSQRDDILAHLQPLVGLPLAHAVRAGGMRGLHFGQPRRAGRALVGEYALHIQCPWRLDGPDGIVTGWTDLWCHPGSRAPEGWDFDEGPNLQDERLAALLGGVDEPSGAYVNETEALVVEEVRCTPFGDVRIHLSGGYRLWLFPAGSAGEHWRLLRGHTDDPHFVVEGNWAGEEPAG
jgi:hypothetical protein